MGSEFCKSSARTLRVLTIDAKPLGLNNNHFPLSKPFYCTLSKPIFLLRVLGNDKIDYFVIIFFMGGTRRQRTNLRTN